MTHRFLFDLPRRLLWAVVAACCLLPVRQAHAADTLKVIVIDGDEAANIVADRLAATPVIEVRDDKDRRVAGAIVRFVIRKTVRNRLAAVFRNGQSEVRTLTDAAGQANSSAITPLEPGSFEIDVEVRYPGQTGKATIRQTNFRTMADAKAAGREPKSTSSNAQSAATNATATAPAAAASAPVVPSASLGAAGGGGMSKLAVAGLVAGGAAGAGAAVVLARRESGPPATVAPIVASQAVGIHSGTVFTFSAQGTGFDAASLAYRWEFGDGASSTEPSPTHVYQAPGTYTVSVTISDARQSARSDTSVTVLALTGTWVSTPPGITWYITQSGDTITGTSDVVGRNPVTGQPLLYTGCPLPGTVRRGLPVTVDFAGPGCSHPQGFFLTPAQITATVAADGRTMSALFTPVQGAPFTILLTRQ